MLTERQATEAIRRARIDVARAEEALSQARRKLRGAHSDWASADKLHRSAIARLEALAAEAKKGGGR